MGLPPSPPARGEATGTSTTESAQVDSTSGGDSTTAITTTTSGEGPTTGDLDTTRGAAPCIPPCGADDQCIDGTCVDTGDTTTGGPPPECSLGTQLNFSTRACRTCAAAACCDELQLCFGDENIKQATACGQLNECIVRNCATVMTRRELAACVDANCMPPMGAYDDWLGWQVCLGSSCGSECS